MLGYLSRLNAQEQQVDSFDLTAKVLWLNAIGSDVFSAVEKQSPVVALRTAPQSQRGAREIQWTIRRSERGFEGKEFLEMLEAHQTGMPFEVSGDHAAAPHIRKLRAREEYLKGILE